MSNTPTEFDGLAANLEMTLREWIERYQREIVFERVQYRGVPSLEKRPGSLIYQKIIWECEIEVAPSGFLKRVRPLERNS